jgi:DNA processing protein
VSGGACHACLRRSALLEAVAGGIDIAYRQRRPIRDVLALEDGELLEAVSGRNAEVLAERVDAATATMLARAARAGLAVVCRHAAAYPAPLRDDPSAPAVLFVAAVGGAARLGALAGRPHGDGPPVVAIVGTRKASDDGLAVARSLGRGLAAAGVTVVSGMALGIDSAAHAGAVEGGGTTVAVLAGGADIPYPQRKRRLYDAIVAGGSVISEMPPGFRGFKWSFPARNRIIAGLAQATVVVEAAERSGSLITAELALDLGREVAAVPGPVISWRSRGTNALLRDGATLIRDARDVLDLVLGPDAGGAASAAAASAPAPAPPGLPAELRRLLADVEAGRDTVEALAAGPADVAAVRAGLMELELLGLVRRAGAGRIQRVIGVGG